MLRDKIGNIPVSKPEISLFDVWSVSRQIHSKNLTSGEVTRKFEREFAQYVGVDDAVAVNSGTSALILALSVLGIGEGDEVIVPSFTFAAPANAVILLNATPVLVDVDVRTFNLDVESLKKSISSKTKAVIVVHLFGSPANLKDIISLTDEYGIALIEDAAQSLGAEYDNRKVGSFGNLACFSFYPSKTITTGEGGMVVAKDPTHLERIRILRNQGMANRYEYLAPGYNFRLTEFQSALGLSQLKRIESLIRKRRKIAKSYLMNLSNLFTLPIEQVHTRHVYNQFTVRLPHAVRDEFIKELSLAGINSQIYYPKTLHEYSFLSSRKSFAISHSVSREVVSLPIYPSMTNRQIDYIISMSNFTLEKLYRNIK